MLRKVIITINPLLDETPAGPSTAEIGLPGGGAASSKPAGPEALMVPKPIRLIAEALTGIVAAENK